eukprot:6565065-Ditylum_brightwellii.AAC.1
MRSRSIRRGRRSRKNRNVDCSTDTKRILKGDFEKERKKGSKEKISKKDQMEEVSTASSEDDSYRRRKSKF